MPSQWSRASHKWPPEKAHPDQDVLPPPQALVDGEVVGIARNIVWLRVQVEGVIKDGRMTLAPDELGEYQVGDHVTDLELVMATPGDWCHILAIPHGFGSTLRRPARAVTDVAGPVDGGSGSACPRDAVELEEFLAGNAEHGPQLARIAEASESSAGPDSSGRAASDNAARSQSDNDERLEESNRPTVDSFPFLF